MKQLYTEHDIIRFLYNEMDEEEYQSFFEVLCKDPEMWAAYEALQEARELLPAVNLEPSAHSETRVLEAARQAAASLRETPDPMKRRRVLPTLWITVLLMTGVIFGYSYHTGWFEASQSPSDLTITEDHSWIRHRLQHMEDNRLLPTPLKNNQYQLINYSGQKVFKFTTGQP